MSDNHNFGEREEVAWPIADRSSSPGRPGQLGAVGRTVTGLHLERGLAVRAMVRRKDDRAAALRGAGAEAVVGDLNELADV